MEQTLMTSKKVLTKLRLINWYTFVDETIPFKGSTLISGENTSGKTTILDAIQMVLTAETHRFNQAAQERSNRSLIGYVRCKLGDDEKSYNRTGTVVSHVALEFYDEEKKNYFTIGVALVSDSPETAVVAKWYRAECSIDSINFVENNVPTLPRSLKQKNSPLQLLDRSAYKEEILIRFGRLESRFFDLIRNSIAFKPMKNVKDFINNFLLPQRDLNVKSMKENISDLHEFERLYDICIDQKNKLDKILLQHDLFRNKEYDFLVIEDLIALAERESIELSIQAGESQIEWDEKSKEIKANQKKQEQEKLNTLNSNFAILSSDRLSNPFGLIAEKAHERIKQLKLDKNREKNLCGRLENALKNVEAYQKIIVENNELSFDPHVVETLALSIPQEEKYEALKVLEDYERDHENTWSERLFVVNSKYSQKKEELAELTKKKENLELHKFAYPEQAVKLKETIENEFQIRGINSRIYFLCDLLELNDESWRNAVEGVLGDYRFYVLVEPGLLNVALELLPRIDSHTYGIIDTRTLAQSDVLAMSNSLASFVMSMDDSANRFISSFLGRFVCCSNAAELNDHDYAITQTCEIYRDSSYSKLNPDLYTNPYIGMNAFEIQIQNVSQEIESVEKRLQELQEEQNKWKSIFDSQSCVNLEVVRDNMNAPKNIADIDAEIAEKSIEEREARSNPDLIMLEEKISDITQQIENQKDTVDGLGDDLIELQAKINSSNETISALRDLLNQKNSDCNNRASENINAYNEAEKKLKDNRVQKDPNKIIENFKPRLKALEGEKNAALEELKELQIAYINNFMCDLRLGTIDMPRYAEIWHKLDSVDIVERKNRLDFKQKECDDIFKNEFVSKMGEAIRDAYSQFKKLNEKLRTLRYGEDTYEFKISYGKEKESLCRMFMDENNLGGETFLAVDFNERYKNELAELYEKVIAVDDENSKIVQEYSDYRSYLDFDIIIHKTEGRNLKYSKVIGEKSGSETQVPFYVAIAASFFVLYDYYPSVRLILFDEAFEKMDDYRIVTTMQFYQKLGLQTILVTPPAKIDTIQSEVDSVIVASRENDRSFVVEYSHAK